ncbi:pentapeptide repeats family protein [Mycobacterium kansasii 824]|nr:pentapeptide repeats family protein [Mycobacterium kansasii 824]
MFNAGLGNTGWANSGDFNSGGFNAGAFNTGSFNPGDTNTGWFNIGDLTTGAFNTGDINTGAFITGDANNGFFWRGTGQGLIAADYTITIPHIPLTLGLGGKTRHPHHRPHRRHDRQPHHPARRRGQHHRHTGERPLHPPRLHRGTTIHFNIPGTDLGFSFDLPSLPISIGVDIGDQIGAITIPQITINPITFNNVVVGGDTTSLSADVAGGIGPVTIPVLQLAAAPGFGNSTGVCRRRVSLIRVWVAGRVSAIVVVVCRVGGMLGR